MEYIDFTSIETVIDIIGVFIIAGGVLFSIFVFIKSWLMSEDPKNLYKNLRHRISRVILLGLEVLIAGDIIHSVANTPNFESVSILALIIIIRLILSIELV